MRRDLLVEVVRVWPAEEVHARKYAAKEPWHEEDPARDEATLGVQWKLSGLGGGAACALARRHHPTLLQRKRQKKRALAGKAQTRMVLSSLPLKSLSPCTHKVLTSPLWPDSVARWA